MNITIFKAAIDADATLNARYAGRTYYRNAPQEQAENDYLSYRRFGRGRPIAEDKNRVEFTLFSKDMVALEDAVVEFINFIETVKIFDGQIALSKAVMLGQSDSAQKLNTGYYFSELNYEFHVIR